MTEETAGAAGAGRATFDIIAVTQAGRLGYEAALLAASLRHSDPGFSGRLVLAHPVAGPLWPNDPAPRDADLLALYAELGAELRPFESRVFGAEYPYGNKIEALSVLSGGRPFLFLDSDTLITGALSEVPFDFDRPAASMRREGTWPRIELYGPGYAATWKALYDRFGLDFASSLDLSQPDEYWQRYLYFNAGWFFYRDAAAFGARFLDWAHGVRDDRPRNWCCKAWTPGWTRWCCRW